MVNVNWIVPFNTFSPPRSQSFATFNIISPSVIPFGNKPTVAVHGVCVNPTYPTKGISISIGILVRPLLVHGIFWLSFPTAILNDGSKSAISPFIESIDSLIDVNSTSIPFPLTRTLPASMFPFSSASTILKFSFSFPIVPSATISFLINPSEMADSLIPEESIRTPFPVSS